MHDPSKTPNGANPRSTSSWRTSAGSTSLRGPLHYFSVATPGRHAVDRVTSPDPTRPCITGRRSIGVGSECESAETSMSAWRLGKPYGWALRYCRRPTTGLFWRLVARSTTNPRHFSGPKTLTVSTTLLDWFVRVN